VIYYQFADIGYSASGYRYVTTYIGELQTSAKKISSLNATWRTAPFWQFTCEMFLSSVALLHNVPVLLCCAYVDDRFWYFVVILAKQVIYSVVSVMHAAWIHWLISVCHCFLVRYFTCVICLCVRSKAHCTKQ